ncbi:redoxin domain-containing protein [Streptomyces sp. OfavH-34-F]|uniref:TlpA family protein disulfide reductase n=1 Tax=unclassified Streptomyces TaxID=2593676 RepID=UPI001EF2C226|nr:redoxin domain-containing protein [Streptomyces sp. OfavH-34-F]MCG7525549.1 redoxin domain-containing protein [Streptomyces sp. OfavH-34-F]
MLVAAVVIIGCLSLFNLLLTLAVARRSSQSTTSNTEPPANRLPDGAPLPEFTVETLEHGTIGRADIQGEAVVGFFSTSCRPCRDQAPDFVKAVQNIPGGREQVLAFVKGGGPAEKELVELLAPVARVVTEPAGGSGASQEAFGIVRWPSYLNVAADGRITGRETVDSLAVPTTPSPR